MKLSVFGRKFEVIRERDQWNLFSLGEGKKHRVDDILIPAHLTETDVITFLADMFHEMATPDNSDVQRLD